MLIKSSVNLMSSTLKVSLISKLITVCHVHNWAPSMMPNDSTKKWTAHFLGMQTWHISLWWRPHDVSAASFGHKTFASASLLSPSPCCTVYVVCLSLSEYFVYDFVAVIKLLKVCDIFMTLWRRASKPKRQPKIIKQQKWSTPIAFVSTAAAAARQHRGTLREIWYQIKSKLKTIKIVSRLTLCLPLLCRLLVFSLISCEIDASEGNFKNSSRISPGICWGR